MEVALKVIILPGGLLSTSSCIFWLLTLLSVPFQVKMPVPTGSPDFSIGHFTLKKDKGTKVRIASIEIAENVTTYEN